jgi:hypothetical protein
LAIFRKRSISLQDIGLVFAACIIPIHLWAILNLLHELPAWFIRLSLGELAGVIAYTQSFALLESLLVLACLLILGLLIPSQWIANRFVVLSSLLIFIVSLWSVVVQYNYDLIRTWGLRQFLPWMILFLISMAAPFFVIRVEKSSMLIKTIVKRLAVLSVLYVIVDVVSVIVVVLRNVV